MDEILKMIIDYSKQNKLIDKKFVKNIIMLLIEINKLQSYVDCFYFGNSLNSNKFGAYNFENHHLIIYYKKIKQYMMKNRIYDVLPEQEQIIAKNIRIFNFILHELEHAKQLRYILSNDDNSIEKYLVDLSLRVPSAIASKRASKNFCDETYNLAPAERMAKICSQEKIVETLQNIEPQFETLLRMKLFGLFYKYLQGYDYVIIEKPEEEKKSIKCPLDKYFYQLKKYAPQLANDLNVDNFMISFESTINNMNFTDRAKLGLPIKEAEYLNCANDIAKVFYNRHKH